MSTKQVGTGVLRGEILKRASEVRVSRIGDGRAFGTVRDPVGELHSKISLTQIRQFGGPAASPAG